MIANQEVAGDYAPVALLYNPDRWKKVSIGRQTVGPMGILPLTESQLNSPGVKQLCKDGQLVKIAELDDEHPRYGAALLERFRDNGSRGSILVSRTYAHGDIFLAATVLDVLKASFPDNELIFHTTERMEALVRHHPGVTIITSAGALKESLRTAGVYIDLDDVPERFEEHNPGAGLNRIEIFGDYIDMAPDSLCPSYYISQGELDSAANYLKPFKKPYIAISPSTMRKEKSWRPEQWGNLAVYLAERTQGTVFNFDVKDILGRTRPSIVPVINKDLRIAGAIAWHMNVFVTQDSLWSHFAAALGVRQVLLASCTDGALLAKGYPNTAVIQRNWDCAPCWYSMDHDDCTYGNYPKCLNDVSVDEVATIVMEACDG